MGEDEAYGKRGEMVVLDMVASATQPGSERGCLSFKSGIPSIIMQWPLAIYIVFHSQFPIFLPSFSICYKNSVKLNLNVLIAENERINECTRRETAKSIGEQVQC